MTRLHTWLIGLAMGSLTVWLLVLGWVNRERDKATATATEARVAWVADSSRLAEVRRALDVRQRSDSLARVEAERRAAEHQRATVKQSLIVAQLRQQLDSTTTLTDSVPALVTIVAQQDTTIQHLSNRADNLANALQSEIRRSAALTLSLAAADSGLVAAQRRIQVLDGLVRTPPQPKLWFGLPREVAIAAGIVGAFVVLR